MNKLIVEQNLSMRLLAKQFALKAEKTEAQRILVTSVEKGAGKSVFVSLLAQEGAILKGEKSVPLVTEDLYTTGPDFFEPTNLIVVDGPAFMEEQGLHVLPEKWLMEFDAAVVIVSIRDTKTTELKKAIEWLSDYGISHIWTVCNLKKIVPFGMRSAQKQMSSKAVGSEGMDD